MKWIRHGRAAVALLAAAVALAGTAAGTAHAADLRVVDDGWITDPSVTPSAFAPGAARAPNGDIVVTYNTDGDGISGARVWLQRSTDDGATWSAPVLVKAPSSYPSGGSVNAQLSLTTLSDGTMLLPITESRTNTRYTDRESVTWVLRSTDSGRTWTGGTTPISFPVPMYFNASYGRVVEAGGALLMPVWGAPTAPSTPGGLINPTPWQAGVLRSTDGGRTWGSYHLIGADLVAPPYTADLPANVTETVVTALPDGRLLAAPTPTSATGRAGSTSRGPPTAASPGRDWCRATSQVMGTTSSPSPADRARPSSCSRTRTRSATRSSRGSPTTAACAGSIRSC